MPFPLIIIAEIEKFKIGKILIVFGMNMSYVLVISFPVSLSGEGRLQFVNEKQLFWCDSEISFDFFLVV